MWHCIYSQITSAWYTSNRVLRVKAVTALILCLFYVEIIFLVVTQLTWKNLFPWAFHHLHLREDPSIYWCHNAILTTSVVVTDIMVTRNCCRPRHLAHQENLKYDNDSLKLLWFIKKVLSTYYLNLNYSMRLFLTKILK